MKQFIAPVVVALTLFSTVSARADSVIPSRTDNSLTLPDVARPRASAAKRKIAAGAVFVTLGLATTLSFGILGGYVMGTARGGDETTLAWGIGGSAIGTGTILLGVGIPLLAVGVDEKRQAAALSTTTIALRF